MLHSFRSVAAAGTGDRFRAHGVAYGFGFLSVLEKRCLCVANRFGGDHHLFSLQSLHGHGKIEFLHIAGFNLHGFDAHLAVSDHGCHECVGSGLKGIDTIGAVEVGRGTPQGSFHNDIDSGEGFSG